MSDPIEIDLTAEFRALANEAREWADATFPLAAESWLSDHITVRRSEDEWRPT